jgi:HPt (histidine-containing phosphotransfer) domain-containing protein
VVDRIWIAIICDADDYRCYSEQPLDSPLKKPSELKQPIDAASLLERCVGDAGFMELVLEKFRVMSDAMVNRISQSVEARDAAQMGRHAHSLKGAAANLSAEYVRSIAGRLEELGQRGVLESAEESLAELRREMERCIAYIPAVKIQLQEKSGESGEQK